MPSPYWKSIKRTYNEIWLLFLTRIFFLIQVSREHLANIYNPGEDIV